MIPDDNDELRELLEEGEAQCGIDESCGICFESINHDEDVVFINVGKATLVPPTEFYDKPELVINNNKDGKFLTAHKKCLLQFAEMVEKAIARKRGH